MTGLPEHNRPAFHEAADELRFKGYEVFNPAELPDGPTYREYLATDLAWICAEATHIALLPGWRNSKGATAEHATAVALGLEVIDL